MAEYLTNENYYEFTSDNFPSLVLDKDHAVMHLDVYMEMIVNVHDSKDRIKKEMADIKEYEALLSSRALPEFLNSCTGPKTIRDILTSDVRLRKLEEFYSGVEADLHFASLLFTEEQLELAYSRVMGLTDILEGNPYNDSDQDLSM